jgi:HEAT repeat protein
VSQVGWLRRVGLAIVITLLIPNLPNLHDPRDLPDLHDLRGQVLAAQLSFEQTTADLASPDPATRRRAAQKLKEAAHLEAAVPLAPLITDPQDEVQFEAIAAELNIFLAEPVVPRKRVGLVVEVRSAVLSESVFSAGPLALGARPAPTEVLTAMRLGARDDNPRVALEALYAFGVLGVAPAGSARRELLRISGPDIAAFVGASDPALRYAAVRVLGRVFAKRAQDRPVEQTIGDAVITALNDDDGAVKAAAMQALGAMRYERSIQALTDLLQYYGGNDAAEAALDALAHIAHPSSAAVFSTELSGKRSARRGMAIEGLARIGDASALREIQTALEADRSDAVTLAGVFAAARLANGPIDRIADALTRPRLRVQARQYLMELLPARASSLTGHLQDPDARLRLEVVDLLGVSGDPAALPLLEPLLKDRDPQVARAAVRAVARLREFGSKN